MFKKLKKISVISIVAFVYATLIPSLGFAVSPATTFANARCPEYVLTFPAWYRGVLKPGTCDVIPSSIMDFIKIPLNFVEILIQAVAYVAVGYVIWGGFKYMKSQGDPGKISEAKSAIINAITGLGIALSSVAIVEFIQGRISI